MTSPSIRTTHTADLTADELDRLRTFLDEAYGGDFAEEDWSHTLGGLHVLVYAGTELVGHASVVQRQLLHGQRPIRTGYVEALAVRADARRHGYGGLAMTEAERIITAAYELGGLGDGTDIEGFYERRGWERWRGPTQVVSPEGINATPEEDAAILILRTPTSPPLDLDAPLACDWRCGDVW